MTRKIVVTTGTRAEYGILRPVLHEITKSKKLQLYLIVTGTHLSRKHGYTIEEIKKDGFKIFATIDMIPKGDNNYFMSEAVGNGIVAFSKIFRKIKPDINLILGDRDEMLSSAITAYHMNIPNAHIHGGDRSGGIDEYTRHAITKMSNIHFAATMKSRKRIIRMGEDPKHVFLTGSPSIDEIVNNKITNKELLEKKYNIKFVGDEILLVQHPVTTQAVLAEKQIQTTLKAIVKANKTTIVIAPNSDAGSKKIFDNLKIFSQKYNFIKIYASLQREDYLGILKNCGVLVGNSSSGLIEASYFNTPVINIGIRQEGREMSNNVFNVKKPSVKTIYETIIKALKLQKRQFLNARPYGSENASSKIVKHLENIKLDEKLIQKKIQY